MRTVGPKDVPAVKLLLDQYLARFGLSQTLVQDEVLRCFCSEASKGIVYNYVVKREGKISDFASFYYLEVR